MTRRSRGLLALLLALSTGVGACVPTATAPSSGWHTPAPRQAPTDDALVAARSVPPGAPATSTPAPTRTPTPTATPRPTPTPRPVPATPEPATASRRVQHALQAALDEARAGLSIPGISATIIFPDNTRWTGVSGLADVAAKEPVTPETAFAIASISKTFLAALALELSADGAFGLEDQVARYLPELDLDPAITVRMLLDHTSGLHDYFLNPRIDRALQSAPAATWSPQKALGYVGTRYFPPGTGWRYSNTNYLVLGLLVERVTERTVAAHLRDRFLDPLGLEGAWYQYVEEPRGPLAHGYRLSGTNSRNLRSGDLADGSGIAPFRSVVTAAGGAGSMAAPSGDVAAWARALYAGAAIASESRSLMLSGIDRVSGYDPRVPYGLGVQAIVVDGRPTFGHSGRLLGFRGAMRWLPDERVAIAVLTNQSRHDPGSIVARLLRIALPEPGRCPCRAPA